LSVYKCVYQKEKNIGKIVANELAHFLCTEYSVTYGLRGVQTHWTERTELFRYLYRGCWCTCKYLEWVTIHKKAKQRGCVTIILNLKQKIMNFLQVTWKKQST